MKALVAMYSIIVFIVAVCLGGYILIAKVFLQTMSQDDAVYGMTIAIWLGIIALYYKPHGSSGAAKSKEV